jgi:hypothetical protein
MILSWFECAEVQAIYVTQHSWPCLVVRIAAISRGMTTVQCIHKCDVRWLLLTVTFMKRKMLSDTFMRRKTAVPYRPNWGGLLIQI